MMTLRSVRRAEAGMCARLRTHFSCVAKKSKQKKATRRLGPLRFAAGQPAVLVSSGVWLNSLRSDNASPGPLEAALLGPASTGWEQTADGPWLRSAPHRGALCARAGKSRKNRFATYLIAISAHPLCARALKSLIFVYLLLGVAKKVSRLPGRLPASALRKMNGHAIKPTREQEK